MTQKRTFIFALALVATLIAPAASAKISNENLPRDPHRQTQLIKQIIQQELASAGEPQSVIMTLTRICMCESGGRNEHGKPTGTIVHIERDGSVRKGDIDARDTGACQINPATHSKRWKRTNGFNQSVANDVSGNIRYARALIEDKRQRGRPIFEDWKPSQTCWRQ